MKLSRAAAILMLSSLVLAGCSDDDDDDPGGVTISAFVGTWNATQIRWTSTSNNQRTLEGVGLGVRLQLAINASGAFTGQFTVPAPIGTGQPIPLVGSVTLRGQNEADVDFTWNHLPAGTPEPIDDFTATYTLSGNTLTFTDDEFTFQFPGQPAPENTVAVIVMTRS